MWTWLKNLFRPAGSRQGAELDLNAEVASADLNPESDQLKAGDEVSGATQQQELNKDEAVQETHSEAENDSLTDQIDPMVNVQEKDMPQKTKETLVVSQEEPQQLPQEQKEPEKEPETAQVLKEDLQDKQEEPLAELQGDEHSQLNSDPQEHSQEKTHQLPADEHEAVAPGEGLEMDIKVEALEDKAEKSLEDKTSETQEKVDDQQDATSVASREPLNDRPTDPIAAIFGRAQTVSTDAASDDGESSEEKLIKTLSASGKVSANKNGKIISIVNQKGGVGKSTTAVNLSAALAEAGKTTLLVDIDPQGNASSGVGLNRGEPHVYCIYDSLINSHPVGDIIKATEWPNLFILPATIDLAGAEIELVPMMARETRLKKIIDPIRNYFDYILIDCPPSIGLLTVNALASTDELIIPIQCEYYALEGLSRLVSSVDLIKNSLNPNLTIGGVLMTMQDTRLKLSNEVVEEVRDHFKEKVFKAVIPRNVRISEAPSHGMPIIAYEKTSVGAVAYRQLAEEVISRG